MLEKTLEGKLRKQIKEIGGLCLKWECPGFTGVPDRMILLEGGCILFVEMKAPGKKERKRQEYVQKQLRNMGFVVFSSVDSEEKIKDVVRYCKEIIATRSSRSF